MVPDAGCVADEREDERAQEELDVDAWRQETAHTAQETAQFTQAAQAARTIASNALDDILTQELPAAVGDALRAVQHQVMAEGSHTSAATALISCIAVSGCHDGIRQAKHRIRDWLTWEVQRRAPIHDRFQYIETLKAAFVGHDLGTDELSQLLHAHRTQIVRMYPDTAFKSNAKHRGGDPRPARKRKPKSGEARGAKEERHQAPTIGPPPGLEPPGLMGRPLGLEPPGTIGLPPGLVLRC